MVRIIRTYEELYEYQKELRNVQWGENPLTVEFLNDSFYDTEPYNWGKEYLKITRINNRETIERVRNNNIVLEYLRYPHIFNVMGIPEDKIYL